MATSGSSLTEQLSNKSPGSLQGSAAFQGSNMSSRPSRTFNRSGKRSGPSAAAMAQHSCHGTWDGWENLQKWWIISGYHWIHHWIPIISGESSSEWGLIVTIIGLIVVDIDPCTPGFSNREADHDSSGQLQQLVEELPSALRNDALWLRISPMGSWIDSYYAALLDHMGKLMLDFVGSLQPLATPGLRFTLNLFHEYIKMAIHLGEHPVDCVWFAC